MTGGLGADTFKVDSGSDIIVDLGGSGSGGENDVLIVSSGATATATNIVNFTALELVPEMMEQRI